MGTSQGVVELSFMVFSVIFNRALRVHGGDEAIAALGVVLGWAAFLYMPAMSLSEAIMPLVGYNYGAGRPDRVRTTFVLSTPRAGAALPIGGPEDCD